MVSQRQWLPPLARSVCRVERKEEEEEDVVRAPQRPRPQSSWLLPRENEKKVGGSPAPRQGTVLSKGHLLGIHSRLPE